MTPEQERDEMAAVLRRLEGLIIDAAAHKLAEAILARPQFGEVVVKSIVDEIGKCAREKVDPMVARILVDRAGDTFAAVDEVVGLIRAETLRAAQQRVAENLPSKDEIRRESLAIVRDAVVRSLQPTVERVANDVALNLEQDGLIARDNARASKVAFPEATTPATEWVPPTVYGDGKPGGRCLRALGIKGTPCYCTTCEVPF